MSGKINKIKNISGFNNIFFLFCFYLLFPSYYCYPQDVAKYVSFGINEGRFTYGLRNFESLLEDFNLSNKYLHKLIKPFNYKNEFRGFNIGYGQLSPSEDSDSKHFWEITWTHHHNIYSGTYEYFSAFVDNNPENDMLIEYKKRLNYLSMSYGLVFIKFAYLGLGLDYGKLSILSREYQINETAPKFERYWHGDEYGSPGGRYLAINLFAGLMPYYKYAAINVRAYYQLQILPSSMMRGTETEFYVNMSNIGIKTTISLGSFNKI